MSGFPWTPAQLWLLRELYPHQPTKLVAEACRHAIGSTYQNAARLGIKKTAAFRASPESGIMIRGTDRGARYRFPKGHVPANKGLRRPGYAPGRMRETQFRKGGFPPNRDPDYYVIGALRINTDGYIDMRVSFEPGAKGWLALHRILWIDAHGPIPRGHIVVFKDRDQLNVCLENLEMITRAELCRRNSVHNLPTPLRKTIQLLGALKRTIRRRTRDEEHRGSEGAPIPNADGSAGQRPPHGARSREDRRNRGPGAGRLSQGGSGNGARNRRPRRQRVLASAGVARA